MEVSSVSSNATSFTTTQAAKTEQPQRIQRSEPEPAPVETRNDESRPSPVVNAQGQTTGKIISTSA